MSEVLTTCDVCEWTWDARTWTRCPRCMGTHKAYEPSGSEITAACEEIRASWSAELNNSRRVGVYKDHPVELTPLVCHHPKPKPRRS